MQLMSMMLVRDRMTANPRTIGPKDNLKKAVDLFEQHRIRHLPVVENDKVVGMVTDRDIRRSNPLEARKDPNAHWTYLNESLAEAIMSKPVVCVSSGTAMREAVRLMVDKKYSALPVCDEGKLVGILSQIDALKAFLDLI